MTPSLVPAPRSIRLVLIMAAMCVVASLVSNPSALGQQASAARVVPSTSTQLVVGIVTGWDDKAVTLHRFTRKQGKAWVEDRAPWKGRLGSRGLAWGRGLHPHEPIPDGATDKIEGDHRAPAGVFRLGTVFGYPVDVPRPRATKYVQVTVRDLLVEDPQSPLYNTHVRLDHPATSQWEIQNRMTLDDPAHELKVFIRHNSDPTPVSGKGSAILFHVARASEQAYTSGCTAMERSEMYDTVAWLDAARDPLYALLPQTMYDQVAASWGLPKQLVSVVKPSTIPVGTKPASGTHRSSVKPVPTTRKPAKGL